MYFVFSSQTVPLACSVSDNFRAVEADGVETNVAQRARGITVSRFDALPTAVPTVPAGSDQAGWYRRG